MRSARSWTRCTRRKALGRVSDLGFLLPFFQKGAESPSSSTLIEAFFSPNLIYYLCTGTTRNHIQIHRVHNQAQAHQGPHREVPSNRGSISHRQVPRASLDNNPLGAPADRTCGCTCRRAIPRKRASGTPLSTSCTATAPTTKTGR